MHASKIFKYTKSLYHYYILTSKLNAFMLYSVTKLCLYVQYSL